MKDLFETSGNTHWWPKSVKSRKQCLRVLKAINRVITPALVNQALPPLPPALWTKMRRKRPDLYKGEQMKTTVQLPHLDRKLWRAFVGACKKWQVSRADALTALIVLFTRMVEADQE